MNKKISVITLTLLVVGAVTTTDVFAQRGFRTKVRTAANNLSLTTNASKIEDASDYEHSPGLDVSNGNTVETPENPGDTGDGGDIETPVDPEVSATIRELKNQISLKMSNVSNSCGGIYNSLKDLKGLLNATFASSSIGAVSSAVATATASTKAVKDKNTSGNTDTLGNWTTGLLVGSAATSAVSTGTSFASVADVDKLIDKMSDCNEKVKDLKLMKGKLKAEMDDAEIDSSNDRIVKRVDKIVEACSGGEDSDKSFDIQGMRTIKGNMIASGVVSGVGTLTSASGTVTSAVSNNKSGESRDKLNTATAVLAGITTGTSIASSATSGVARWRSSLDDNISLAEKCQNALSNDTVKLNTGVVSITYTDEEEDAGNKNENQDNASGDTSSNLSTTPAE